MFYPSVSGMEAYSHAMSTVSTNIANVNTIGYKKTETLFYTMLGSNPVVKGDNSGLNSSRTDISGVGTHDRTHVTAQGVISATGKAYDVAINGTGNAFFMVNDEFGNTYYTRAGSFTTRTVDGETYLISPNGYRVQGFVANEDGTFSSGTSDIKINPDETIPSNPTSKIEIIANVGANEENNSYALTVYGPGNDGRNVSLTFSKDPEKANTWIVSAEIEGNSTIVGGGEVQFDDKGNIITPKSLDFTVNWSEEDGGGSNNVTIDISKMTQYAGENYITNISQDGYPSGNLEKTYFDENGVLTAVYSNKQTKALAKLALVGFEAPENMENVSGTMFKPNKYSGDSYFLTDDGMIVSGAVESSTANVEEDFSKMIIIQRAYSVNASSFTTNNEMLQTAVDLKS